MKVNLHLGAHKTATTFIQSMFQENVKALNEAGVGYLNLTEFRRRYTQQLMSLPSNTFTKAVESSPLFGHPPQSEVTGLILSDENLIGSPVEFIRSGQLYPEIPMRVSKLRELLAGCDVTLFFCIRDYANFLASNYCEGLRHMRQFHRFVDFRTRLDSERFRWPAIVGEIIDNLKPSTTFVWKYEDFRSNAQSIAEKMAFGMELHSKRGADLRPSSSQTAIDVVEFIADRHGPIIAGRCFNAIGDLLPKGPELEAFQPWTMQQERVLDKMYAEDCRRMPCAVQTFTADRASSSA